MKGYLGAVVKLKSKDRDFFDFYKIADPDMFFEKKKARDILRDVVLWELAKAGFKDEGKVVEKENISMDKALLVPGRKGKNVVLTLNEGYWCDFTLKKILAFEKSGDIEEDSVELARLFVDAGLAIPKEAFIAFFEKVRGKF